MTAKLIKVIDAMNLDELCEAIAIRQANSSKMVEKDILARFEESFNEVKDVEGVDNYFYEIPDAKQLLLKVNILCDFYEEGSEIHNHLEVLRSDLIKCLEVEARSGSPTRKRIAPEDPFRVGTKTPTSPIFPYSLSNREHSIPSSPTRVTQSPSLSPSHHSQGGNHSPNPSNNMKKGFIELIRKMDLDELHKAIEIRNDNSVEKGKEEHKPDVLDEFEAFFNGVEAFVYLAPDLSPVDKDLVEKTNVLLRFYDRPSSAENRLVILANLRALFYLLQEKLSSAPSEREQGSSSFLQINSYQTEILKAIDIRITQEKVSILSIEGAIAGLFRRYGDVDPSKMVPEELMQKLNDFYSDMLTIAEKYSISSQQKIGEFVSVYKKHESILYPSIEELLFPIKKLFSDRLSQFVADRKDYFDELIYAYMAMCFQEVTVNILEDIRIVRHEDSVNLKEIISNIVSIMQISKEQRVDPVDILTKMLASKNEGFIGIKDHSDTEEGLSSSDGYSVSSVSAPVNSNGGSRNYSASSVSAPVRTEYVRIRPHRDQSNENLRRRIGGDKRSSSFFSSFFSGSSDSSGSSPSKISPSGIDASLKKK